MWDSLKRHQPAAELHVLCLSPACEEMLAGLRLPGVHALALSDVEARYSTLAEARRNRSALEYYFTLTPFLPLVVLDDNPSAHRVTYIDADLFFLDDPRQVLDEVGAASVGVIEHRFPERLKEYARFGRFNVGWLTFRNDINARTCLERWGRQSVEWCYDRVEPGRFAEQKYLDEWPDTVHGLKVLQHKGANLAPWNLDRFALTARGNQLFVDDQPVVFFHAHGFEPAAPGVPGLLGLEPYGATGTSLLHDYIFDPYSRAIDAAIEQLAPALASALIRDRVRVDASVLSAQLRAREADCAARLQVIQSLEADCATRLEAIDALTEDCAARLDVIGSLEGERQRLEADCVARLELIRSLEAACEARLDVIHTLEDRVRGMESSLSWRLTRSLRSADQFLQDLRGTRRG